MPVLIDLLLVVIIIRNWVPQGMELLYIPRPLSRNKIEELQEHGIT